MNKINEIKKDNQIISGSLYEIYPERQQLFLTTDSPHQTSDLMPNKIMVAQTVPDPEQQGSITY